MTPDILTDPESQHPGFSESVKNVRGPKQNKLRIAICNIVQQNMSGGDNKMCVREKTIFFIQLKRLPDSLKTCCLKAGLVTICITKYGEEVLLNDTFRFCSNLAFNVTIQKSNHIFLPHSHNGFYTKSLNLKIY